MAIEFDKVLAGEIPVIESNWDEDAIILYHLGLGAGADWLNARELSYTYEKNLQVLPTYAVIPPYKTAGAALSLPGVNMTAKTQVLHGDHEITIHKAIPTKASVETRSKIVDIYKKKTGALFALQNDTYLKGDDEPLFTNRWGLYIKGEEGRIDAPLGAGGSIPDREPDAVRESYLIPQITHIYRLSGDKIPFHIDPEIAGKMGFETPITQGLLTYGVVCKAVVDELLDYDGSRVRSMYARFAKPVFPGETLVTRMWEEEKAVIAQTVSQERGVVVLDNVRIDLAS